MVKAVPVAFQDTKDNLYFLMDETGEETFFRYRTKSVRYYYSFNGNGHNVKGETEIIAGQQRIYRDDGDGHFDRRDKYIAPRSDAFRSLLADCNLRSLESVYDVASLTAHVDHIKQAKVLSDRVKASSLESGRSQDFSALADLVWADINTSRGNRYNTPKLYDDYTDSISQKKPANLQRLAELRLEAYVKAGIIDVMIKVYKDTAVHIAQTGRTKQELTEFDEQIDTAADLMSIQNHSPDEVLRSIILQDIALTVDVAAFERRCHRTQYDELQTDNAFLNYGGPYNSSPRLRLESLLNEAKAAGLAIEAAQKMNWTQLVLQKELKDELNRSAYIQKGGFDLVKACTELAQLTSLTPEAVLEQFWSEDTLLPDFVDHDTLITALKYSPYQRRELLMNESIVKAALTEYRNADQTPLNLLIACSTLLFDEPHIVSYFFLVLESNSSPQIQKTIQAIALFHYKHFVDSGMTASLKDMCTVLLSADLLELRSKLLKEALRDDKVPISNRIFAADKLNNIDALEALSNQCQRRDDYYRILRILIDKKEIQRVNRLTQTEQGKRFGADKAWNDAELLNGSKTLASGL